MRTSVRARSSVLGCLTFGATLLTLAPLQAQMPDRASAKAFLSGKNLAPDQRLMPPSAKVAGLTIPEWGARWWQWVLSIDCMHNPILDSTGQFGATSQSGNVWFLSGTSGSSAERWVTIPNGKHLFFPIINYINDWPCPDPGFCPNPATREECLTAGAVVIIDGVTNLDCVIDGIPVPSSQLFRGRGTSSMFTFTASPDLRGCLHDSCLNTDRTPQPAVSDGFWVLAKPLNPGDHTIYFHGKLVLGTWVFETSVLYHITIG